jgi:CRISPR-associated protein Csx10
MVYNVTEGSIDPEKLAELEAKGIGDRRAEGYGQILFNDPLLLAKTLSKLEREDKNQNQNSKNPETKSPIFSKSSNSGKNVELSASVFDYARTIEIAAWREAIQNKALKIAAKDSEREKILGIKITHSKDKHRQPESQPSMSQLGRLRSNLRRLQSPDDIEKIEKWIDALQEKRQDKWEKTQDGLKKVRDLLTDTKTVWKHLNLNYEQLTMTVNDCADIKTQLWADAVRTLVDEIVRTHKRTLEDAEDRSENNSN